MNAIAKKKEVERETEIAIVTVWPLLGPFLVAMVVVVVVGVGEWGVRSALLPVPFIFVFVPPATPVSPAPSVLPGPVAVGAALELASV